MGVLRSEVEVTADVVVELMARGLLPKDRAAGLARVLHITAADITAAAEVRQRTGRGLPRPHRLAPTGLVGRESAVRTPREELLILLRAQQSAAPENLKPDGRKRPKRRRPTQRDVDGNEWLFCTSCPAPNADHLAVCAEAGIDPGDAGAGRWHRAERFHPKSKAPGSINRASACDDCRPRYQRTRYLRARTLDAMASLGIDVVVGADLAEQHLVCKGCGEPFTPGDGAVAEAVAYHARCAPAHLCD